MKKYFKGIYILFKLLGESFNFAFSSIRANKMRTFLSLLGVTIGIFSITTVLTMVDALEDNIRAGVSELGGDVIYIQKYPWGGQEDGEYKWWEYAQRPSATYDEYMFLRNHSQLSGEVALICGVGRTVKYNRNTIPRVSILGVTPEWSAIGASFEVSEGRLFSPMEYSSGNNVVVIGHQVREELFAEENPIGKTITIGGIKATVIGTLKKQGNSILTVIDYDNLVSTTLGFIRSFVDLRRGDLEIAVKAKEGVDKEDLKAELSMLMRAQRRLKPVQKDNFALNEMTAITQQLDQVFSIINIVGVIIGGFSVLIGGFGIANIMFVSVKERTNIIGIQKALGAKKYFILTQFLYEAALLAVAGGVIGLLLVYGGTTVISSAMDYPITLSVKNILTGLVGSAVIGIIAGFLPAYSASRLNPVVAINTK